MRVYVAGPMTGIADFNFPAFRAAAEDLRDRGHDVLSPAEMDEAEGFSPDPDGKNKDMAQYAHFLSRDIDQIAKQQIDAIALLPGWEASKGVAVEIAFAEAIGADVLLYPDLVPRGEVRVVNAKTGGAKGSKAQRMDLIPYGSLLRVAEVYDFGAQKYAAHNWRKGYDWGLSFAAMQRHLSLFWEGQDRDEETGLSHLAHAAFHVLGLIHFTEHEQYADMDDRPPGGS